MFQRRGFEGAQGRKSAAIRVRFAQRGKGNAFFGPKHAAHPINAMLNYCYIVEAGRLAKALAAQGLALPIGYLHKRQEGPQLACMGRYRAGAAAD